MDLIEAENSFVLAVLILTRQSSQSPHLQTHSYWHSRRCRAFVLGLPQELSAGRFRFFLRLDVLQCEPASELPTVRALSGSRCLSRRCRAPSSAPLLRP